MPVPEHHKAVWQSICKAISDCTKRSFTVDYIRPVSGGCINSAVIIGDSNASYFVKLNSAKYEDMFEAEADGLRHLAAANALRVPMPLCCGTDRDHAWLVLENLGHLGSTATEGWHELGQGLALMHRRHQKSYGWHRDNTIGSTPQINTPSNNWIEFLREHRIGFQIELAVRNGYGKPLQSRGCQLLDCLPHFFTSYSPNVSLLHGDLWSGNVGFLTDGQPVLFDPAVYFGDREADIAMSQLFGSFSPAFYRAYEAVWPLDEGYRIRKQLYNLYHLLNHLNLFGQAYLGQCKATIDGLLAQVR
ncbi:MAG: phosphotransferase [Burkholderiales bacterium]|nr:phosphotransferase [Burkholderiales bacterium]